MTDALLLKAPKAKGGFITVREGDGIHGDFLRIGQKPWCDQTSPTICSTGNKLWVVVRQ